MTAASRSILGKRTASPYEGGRTNLRGAERGGRGLRSSRCVRRAFTLAETVLSITLVGGLLVAALDLVGDATIAQHKTSDRSRGQLLASALMAEILAQAYEEADIANGELAHDFKVTPALPTNPTKGRDSSESGGSRIDFDDIDDYDAWTASPPERKDGTIIPDHDGWERSVTVEWRDPQLLNQPVAEARGVKCITVTVTRNGIPVAQSEAIRTVGLPPPQDSITLLYVVADPASLTAQESLRKVLFESWSYTVELIAEDDTQLNFDAAVAKVDAAYVHADILETSLGDKLRLAPVGVVNECMGEVEPLGFASNTDTVDDDEVFVDDNTHYITSEFALGWLTILTGSQPIYTMKGTAPTGVQVLAYTRTSPAIIVASLVLLEQGDGLIGGGTCPANRAQLPWGQSGFDIDTLNADGLTIMQRAIEWAAGRESGGATPAVCGDAMCDATEDVCTCPADCGAPPPETPNVTCTDGEDNDCDGLTDCDDADCDTDPACAVGGAVCGNFTCESGEDCLTCPSDCLGQTGGKPSSRYCCGNGVLEPLEGDGSACHGNP